MQDIHLKSHCTKTTFKKYQQNGGGDRSASLKENECDGNRLVQGTAHSRIDLWLICKTPKKVK
jgi:hypothetical protein